MLSAKTTVNIHVKFNARNSSANEQPSEIHSSTLSFSGSSLCYFGLFEMTVRNLSTTQIPLPLLLLLLLLLAAVMIRVKSAGYFKGGAPARKAI